MSAPLLTGPEVAAGICGLIAFLCLVAGIAKRVAKLPRNPIPAQRVPEPNIRSQRENWDTHEYWSKP